MLTRPTTAPQTPDPRPPAPRAQRVGPHGGPGSILRLSQGSYAKSILARNTLNRVLAMDLDGFFREAFLAFFKADTDGEYPLSPRHTVLDWAVTSPGGGRGAALRAEAVFFRRALRLIRARGIRVLSANDPYLSGLNALLLSRLARIPYTVEIVSDYDLTYQASGKRAFPLPLSRPVEKRLERRVLRSAAAVYADRDHYLDYARRNGAREGSLFQVRCVTDPFYYTARPRHPLEHYVSLSGDPALLYVGRLAADKYALDLVDCLAEIHRQGTRAHLLLAGDGNQREALLQRARELELAPFIHPLGNRTAQELVDLAAGAQVIVAPHMGYALLEACLSGTPVVAYDYEWHPELIHDGETGLLAPHRDPAAMAAAVLRLLRDGELATRLGETARARVLTHHHPDDALHDERRMYESLLIT